VGRTSVSREASSSTGTRSQARPDIEHRSARPVSLPIARRPAGEA
jgi:hypothetical protein